MSTGKQGESYVSGETPVVVVGQTGGPGKTGQTGQTGPVGKAGRDGAAAFFNRTQVLTLFAFIVMVFLLLAWRSEINNRAIKASNHDNRQRQYEACQISRENAASLGEVLDQIVVGVKRRTDIPPSIRAETVRIYSQAKPKVIACGPRPSHGG